MSDSNSNQAAQRANLARIRDNQRRSRARRKEYLQELETKYRTCEAVGVEASAEIQAAARRVLDENKRLRQLLKQQGLSEAQIDGFSPASSPATGAPAFDDGTQISSSSDALDQLLTTRRSCKPESGCGGGNSSTPAAEDILRKQSCASSAPSQPSPTPALLSARPQHQKIAPAFPTLQPAPHARPLSSMSASPANEHFLVQPGPQQPIEYTNYDPRSHNAYMYPTRLETMSPWDAIPVSQQSTAPQHQAFLSTAEPSANVYVPDLNTSSCYVAADAIRSFSANAGPEVEQALGCRDGAECHVSNSVVFDLMDRYAGSGN